VRLYDAEIEYTDREIGNLLATLKDKGMLDNTIVILTSDHGEEFYEHKQFGHGQSTFSELSHIPLFIAGPGISSGVSSVPVELVDLYPTIATWAGAPVPQSIHGRDLSALLAGGDDRQRNSLVQNIKVGELHSLIVGRHKLVHVLSSSKQESWMLFDLDVDPGELNDISGDNPELMDKLREILASRRSESERYRVDETTEVVFDAATTQDLQGLGYLDDEEEE
jgi:arylsulfatase A-like enzyme